MNSAELRTIREALGLSRDEAASWLEVSSTRLRQWEDGNRPVPVGVLAQMRSLAIEAERFTTLEVRGRVVDEPTGETVVLLRYRSAEDRVTDEADGHDPAERADRGCDLPVVVQAVASWRAAQILLDHGHDARLAWFNPREYSHWLGDRANTAAAHRQWATTQQ